MNENVEYVKRVLPCEVRFTQLAEEATELAQAALKMFRILDGRNPTPVTPEEGMANLYEEISDVLGALRALDLTGPEQAAGYAVISSNKFERWVGRLKEKYGEQ